MSGINHTAAHLAARTQLLTLSVVTTGSTTLSATTTGYARAAGSFVTDGFAVGMEVTPSGFAVNTVDVITAVTALALTVKNTRTAEAAAGSRTLAVLLPATRAWENVEIEPTTGVPYISEEYVPGPTEKITLGPLGEVEALPLYLPRIFVPKNIGRAAASKYADALLNLFAPGRDLTISGASLSVRTSPGPFPGQLLQTQDGWAFVPVTIPLRYRVANAI